MKQIFDGPCVVFECVRWEHHDDDGHGGATGERESLVHTDTSPENARKAMNEHFLKKKEPNKENKTSGDHRMTCMFKEGSFSSTESGNYNGGGYYIYIIHFEIRPAPKLIN